jgi:Flp pilus assembly pilin Flp
MNKFWRDLWEDEAGMIISAELIVISTVLVIGLITGLTCVQQALVAEFRDLGLAFSGMNQSYGTPSYFGCFKWWGRTSFVAGSRFTDVYDGCVGCGNAVAAADVGVGVAPSLSTTIVAPPAPVAPTEPCPPVVREALPAPSANPCPPVVEPPCNVCPPAGVPVPGGEIPQGPAPQILPQAS